MPLIQSLFYTFNITTPTIPPPLSILPCSENAFGTFLSTISFLISSVAYLTLVILVSSIGFFVCLLGFFAAALYLVVDLAWGLGEDLLFLGRHVLVLAQIAFNFVCNTFTANIFLILVVSAGTYYICNRAQGPADRPPLPLKQIEIVMPSSKPKQDTKPPFKFSTVKPLPKQDPPSRSTTAPAVKQGLTTTMQQRPVMAVQPGPTAAVQQSSSTAVQQGSTTSVQQNPTTATNVAAQKAEDDFVVVPNDETNTGVQAVNPL